jgi:outer membrane protein insertion porin family
MAMHTARHQGSTRTKCFCGSLLLLLLSLFLTTDALARDATAVKADVEREIKTPKIDFIGNTAFSSNKLREVLSSRKQRWFTASGNIIPKAFYEATDFELAAFYYRNGFLSIQIDHPQIVSADRAMIAIYEGPRYRFGSIAIEGRLRLPRRDVESQLTMRSGQPFVVDTLQHDVDALADFYSDRGFAFVSIDPTTRMDSRRHLINVKFLIKPGDETRIGQITISGNTITPEQVIRAALRIHEHELYSARALRESKARLDELDLFSGTQITTQPSTKSGEINVRVTIVEKSKVSSASRCSTIPSPFSPS